MKFRNIGKYKAHPLKNWFLSLNVKCISHLAVQVSHIFDT